MKVKIFFAAVLMILTTAMSSQANLYKGITSGMSQIEFNQHINSVPELSWAEDNEYVNVQIKGRPYVFIPDFNNAGQLSALYFYCGDRYKWYEYDPTIKAIAVDVYSLFEIAYGEPIYDRWPNWTDIPKGGSEIACAFKKDSVLATIIIGERDEVYLLGMIVVDIKFRDPSVPSSDGF
jgi:hypothetical protein